MKQRLDTYDRIPPAMADYLSQYGWHFSKKMYDVDAYNGMPFTRFYADCIGSGNPIMWEQMM